ncbi:alanine--tRNA ligase-related protein [Patescibacteria group bacterium]|nr:alanine--tRNA ligase-related protein [Patescibacteria group bacterium]MCL5091234.1 alanine--tRNA ligase-related protein [Patescibacteria group bacterium]
MDHPTKLKYMEDSYLLTDGATVIELKKDESDNDVLVLDQTVFYPQGGGQPYDQGIIGNDQTTMTVNEVRFFAGQVLHIGKVGKGSFNKGDKVKLAVEEKRRAFNRRNHTAGHLIDIAIKTVGDFTPVKGFHFPAGAYVEYMGVVDETKKEEIKAKIQAKVNQLIDATLSVTSRFVTKDQLQDYCDFVPTWLPEGKPIRIITVSGQKSHPCGGTHVKNTFLPRLAVLSGRILSCRSRRTPYPCRSF